MKSLQGYQELAETGRLIYLNGEVDSFMVDTWRKSRDLLLEKPEGDVGICLNTTGGNAWDGTVIFQEIKAMSAVPNRSVWMICQGAIFSMGVYIAMGIDRSHRVAFPFTTFYCHKTYSERQIDDQALTQMAALSSEAKRAQRYAKKEDDAAGRYGATLERQMRRLLVEGTHMTSQEVAQLINYPRHLGVREAIKLGFVCRELR